MTCVGAVALALLGVGVARAQPEPAQAHAPSNPGATTASALAAAIARAGDNAAELREAIDQVRPEHAASAAFLIAHMPEQDLRAVTADAIIENIGLAHEARARFPWAASIPDDVFRNDVLPMAIITERRDPWRREFLERFGPVVQGATSATDAADRLNRAVFNTLNVHYNTKRKRPDQSWTESVEQGAATCTGLSIILVNACRAVGVPARLAGVYEWADKQGNHTWVEIYDPAVTAPDGSHWHFVGADEPDDRGLNNGWFVGDASRAVAEHREHAVWATSYAPTGESFPLVFAPEATFVHGVNVTRRYAHREPVDASLCRVLVRVVDGQGRRVAMPVRAVTLLACGLEPWEGVSRDERYDLNDILEFRVPRSLALTVAVVGGAASASFTVPDADTHEVVFTVGPTTDQPTVGDALDVLPDLTDTLQRWFEADDAARAEIDLSRFDGLLLARPTEVRAAAWSAYKAADVHAELEQDLDANAITANGYTSPFVVREVGEKPEGGWPLVIAMHGGGGAPQEVNDQQWRHMQIYYKDHPELGGYLYLALRAPTNEWNGFYTDYMYPIVQRLIRAFTATRDVNPDRVYLIGYSHGGYGAFAIGPKMPDLFAAIHSSAAAPTDGETTPLTLRSTRFTHMIGENDTAYGRAERNQAFAAEVARLRQQNPGAYPVEMLWQPGFGHGGLPDRDFITQLYPYTRNPAPSSVTWLQTDSVITDLFWIHDPTPVKQRLIEARIDDRHKISIRRPDPAWAGVLRLDERHLDLTKEITMAFDVPTRESPIDPPAMSPITVTPRVTTLARSLLLRGDPGLAWTIEVSWGELPVRQP